MFCKVLLIGRSLFHCNNVTWHRCLRHCKLDEDTHASYKPFKVCLVTALARKNFQISVCIYKGYSTFIALSHAIWPRTSNLYKLDSSVYWIIILGQALCRRYRCTWPWVTSDTESYLCKLGITIFLSQGRKKFPCVA